MATSCKLSGISKLAHKRIFFTLSSNRKLDQEKSYPDFLSVLFDTSEYELPLVRKEAFVNSELNPGHAEISTVLSYHRRCMCSTTTTYLYVILKESIV